MKEETVMKTIGNTRGLTGRLTLFALAALAATAAGCGGGHSHGQVVCGTGAVFATWTITAGGAAVSCAQVGATEVDINVDNMSAPFSCNDHQGTTPEVVGGVTHNVSLSLLDSGGNVLSQTQTMGLLVHCDTVEDIGDVELSVSL
jgi:hypothetical protein